MYRPEPPNPPHGSPNRRVGPAPVRAVDHYFAARPIGWRLCAAFTLLDDTDRTVRELYEGLHREGLGGHA